MLKPMTICLALAAVLVCGAEVRAQSVDEDLNQSVMLGFNRTTGTLLRYDFAQRQCSTVGTVRTGSGRTLLGIDAAAYVPGFTNVFAFWLDPTDNACKLVYVNTETAEASIVADDMEGGRITGAVALETAKDQWTVFAMQLAEAQVPFTVTGQININPNNSPQNEFELTKPNGSKITRDDLHMNSPVGGDGVYYTGDATLIRVKPKGNGNQNGMIINGEPYPLQNSNTYILSGEMVVKLYNDKLKNGKCMGHWWIQIISGTAIFMDETEVGTPDRLVSVDHKTGVVTELMAVDRAYDGLASSDGLIFYATAGDDLYKLDPIAETETRIGDISSDHVRGLEFCQSHLLGFETDNDRLFPVDVLTGAKLASPVSLGMFDLGTMVFTPRAQDPAASPKNFD